MFVPSNEGPVKMTSVHRWNPLSDLDVAGAIAQGTNDSAVRTDEEEEEDLPPDPV
jgi:hypothetical protein